MRRRLFLPLLCLAACGPSGPAVRPASETRLIVQVTDKTSGEPVAATLVLFSEDGELLRIGGLDYSDIEQDLGYCELADGAIGTWEGIALPFGSAEIPIGDARCEPTPHIPYGSYRAVVHRGIEYEIFEAHLDLTPGRGRVLLEAPLERVFSVDNALSADLHVHSEGSNDSNLPRPVRVMTLVASGIQVIGGADHNVNGDFADDIRALGLEDVIASLPGNEVSVDLGHFNVFPVEVTPSSPRGGAPSYEELASLTALQLLTRLRGLPGKPLVQVNHPRFRWAAYFDGAGWDGESWPPRAPLDFDALEVLSGVLTFNTDDDPRQEQSLRDFYTLARNHVFVTATGNSDSHHLSGVLGGVPRTYVFVSAPEPGNFDADEFVASLKARRAVATSGPWLDVVVNGKAGPGQLIATHDGFADIHITVKQASFVKANRLRVWIGGQLRHDISIPEGARAFEWEGREAVTADTWIGADVSGHEPLPRFMTGDYMERKGRPGLLPYAVINPILLDADGDGTYRIPPRPAYADRPAPLTGAVSFDCLDD